MPSFSARRDEGSLFSSTAAASRFDAEQERQGDPRGCGGCDPSLHHSPWPARKMAIVYALEIGKRLVALAPFSVLMVCWRCGPSWRKRARTHQNSTLHENPGNWYYLFIAVQSLTAHLLQRSTCANSCPATLRREFSGIWLVVNKSYQIYRC